MVKEICVFICSVMSNSFVSPWTVASPGSSVRGVIQAKILEWVAISSFRSSQPRDQTCIFCDSCTADRFSLTEPLENTTKIYISWKLTSRLHPYLACRSKRCIYALCLKPETFLKRDNHSQFNQIKIMLYCLFYPLFIFLDKFIFSSFLYWIIFYKETLCTEFHST